MKVSIYVLLPGIRKLCEAQGIDVCIDRDESILSFRLNHITKHIKVSRLEAMAKYDEYEDIENLIKRIAEILKDQINQEG